VNWSLNKTRPWIRYAFHRLEDTYLDRKKASVINCIGDSHNNIFAYIQKCGNLPELYLRCTTVMGATVFGLANPNSKTNALPIFQREIRAISRRQAISLMLGEIDCGFLVFLRAKKKGGTLESEMEESIRRYRIFLNEVKRRGVCMVFVWSVPPPTIMDNRLLGDVPNMRKEVTASIHERTRVTSLYNERLRKIVSELGFQFMDMDPHLKDPRTGLVKNELLNPDPRDHHLYPEYAAPLFVSALHEHVPDMRRCSEDGLT